MNAYRIIFADSQYNFTTGFNGTLDQAKSYYIGQSINFGDRFFGDKDNLQTPIAVELA